MSDRNFFILTDQFRRDCINHGINVEDYRQTDDAPLAPARTTIVLPYPVSANRYWESFVPNGARRAIVHLSTEAKAYKNAVQVRAAMAGVRKPTSALLDVTFRLFPDRPKDWEKRERKDPNYGDHVRSIDLGNCEKVACDALNGIAWVDDKQIHRMLLVREPPDAHGARLVVEFGELPPRKPFSPSLFDAEVVG